MNETVRAVNGTTNGDDMYVDPITGIVIGLSVFGVLIFAANGLVFLLFCKEKSLRRKSNYFLISLAVSDISSGLVGIPLVVVCNSFGNTIDELCRAMDISNKFLAISTILHLLSATIERYIKVLAPLHYKALVTRQRVLLILAGIWLFSLTMPLIELLWNNLEVSKIYSLTLLCCFVILPLVIMTFMTVHIFYLIRQQKKRFRNLSNRCAAEKQRRRKQAERRATIVYSAMSFSFAVSWFPYFFLAHLSDYAGGYSLPQWVDIMFLFLKFSSGLVDPLLYTFFKTDFQAALKATFISPSNNAEVRVPLTSMQTQRPPRSSSD